nr:MAG TPA: hypothetical protein [Caudoviricetes sp.]
MTPISSASAMGATTKRTRKNQRRHQTPGAGGDSPPPSGRGPAGFSTGAGNLFQLCRTR